MNAAGEEEMDLEGDEFAPTDEEIAREKQEVPTMMKHAEMWDRFIPRVGPVCTGALDP